MPDAVRLEGDAIAGRLQHARALIGTDPASAVTELRSVAAAATEAGLAGVAAEAEYAIAQATAAAGDFVEALALIDAARASLAAAGCHHLALRTGLGRAHVLNEMGRHAEAAEECNAIASVIALGGPVGATPAERSATLANSHQNRGLCLELQGHWDVALDAYSQAIAAYDDLGDAESRGEVLNNRGHVLLALGRVHEAEIAFDAARSALVDSPDLLAYALNGLAEVCVLDGRYTMALDLLSQARVALQTAELPLVESDRAFVAGRAYEALNLHDEALAAYREAGAFFDGAGLAVEGARAAWRQARVQLRAGYAADACRELHDAVGTFRRVGHHAWIAGSLLDLAAAEAACGRPETAVAFAEDAAEAATRGGASMEATAAHLALARLAADRSDRSAARSHVAAAERTAAEIGLTPLRVSVTATEGIVHHRLGESAEAWRALEHAAAEIERMPTMTGDIVSGRRLGIDRVEVFDAMIDLATTGADPTDGAAAHRLVERARAQRLGVLRTDHSVRRVAADESMRQELDALYAAMLEPTADQDTAARLAGRARSLETALSRGRLDAASTGTAADAPAKFADGSATLGERVLSWYALGDEVVAFVGLDDGWTFRRNVTSMRIIVGLLDRLEAHWSHVRAFGPARADRLERACRSILQALYDELLRPLADLLDLSDPDVDDVVVVAHGALHRVPFHALHDGERAVVDLCAVNLAPSVADYRLRSAIKTSGSGRSVVVGAADATTPAVLREVKLVAAELDHVVLRAGDAATADGTLADAEGAAVLHLAGHAVFRRDNPMFSAIRLADRWVSAHELLDVDLTGALVTLSACESARHDGQGEELAGLSRTVLGAGAKSLVASLWPADDESTSVFMAEFYRCLRRQSPNAALRSAQLAQRERTPHPYHWAPFVITGGRS